MSERLRIGEILLQRESIDETQLVQAIRDQTPGQRLVSMLIKRTLIDPDEGALALSQQTGFPAALQRHLEARHEDVRPLLPATLARRWVVVPVGRAREGTLVVCARDPTPMLAAALQHALSTPVKLAVAPAILVERLLASMYGPLAASAPVEEPAPPSLADTGMVPVGQHAPKPARTVSRMLRGRPESGLGQARALGPLDATLQEIEHAFSLAAVEKHVLAFAGHRWAAALLVKIVDGIAIGQHGHGERLGVVDAFMLPVESPSLIQAAHDTRQIAIEPPRSEVQQRLTDLLGDAGIPIAGPVIVGERVAAVLVVGDPVDGGVRESIADLERLLDGLGAAYERFARSAPDLADRRS